MRVVMLTTIDNPYDPFDEFDEWFAYDTAKGYHSCAYLARVTGNSDELPDEIIEAQTEQAINEIISMNLSGVHKKIVRELAS